MGEALPRLLWLNGPHYVGKRTLAARLRDRWGVVVLDADAVGHALQDGLPTNLEPGDVQDNGMWRWSMWRLGLEMARTYGIVAIAATVYRPAAVPQLITAFRRAEVDVLHVILEADAATLRARIHDHDVSRDAKRWALEHLRPALTGLSELREGISVDTTGLSPDQVATDLAKALMHHGWLTPDRAWTTTNAEGTQR